MTVEMATIDGDDGVAPQVESAEDWCSSQSFIVLLN